MTYEFRYFVRESFDSLRAYRGMSIASAGMTAICLLLMGTFALAALNVDANISALESGSEILAFVDESYTQTQARSLQPLLQGIPNIASARFITKEEAMESFSSEHPGEPMFQNLDPEIFRDRYALRVINLEDVSATAEKVEALEGIDDVNVHEELTGGILTVRNIATILCIALSGILFAMSLFILSNTIRLTAFNRREEIAIMRIVGASNGFIRWPFVCEGAVLGFSGAFAAFFLQWGLYAGITKWIAESDSMRLFEILPFAEIWPVMAVSFFAAGLCIGIGGSLFGIRRFLKF